MFSSCESVFSYIVQTSNMTYFYLAHLYLNVATSAAAAPSLMKQYQIHESYSQRLAPGTNVWVTFNLVTEAGTLCICTAGWF